MELIKRPNSVDIYGQQRVRHKNTDIVHETSAWSNGVNQR